MWAINLIQKTKTFWAFVCVAGMAFFRRALGIGWCVCVCHVLPALHILQVCVCVCVCVHVSSLRAWLYFDMATVLLADCGGEVCKHACRRRLCKDEVVCCWRRDGGCSAGGRNEGCVPDTFCTANGLNDLL